MFNRINMDALQFYTKIPAKTVGGEVVVLGATTEIIKLKQTCAQRAFFLSSSIMLSQCRRPLVSRLPATGENASETL